MIIKKLKYFSLTVFAVFAAYALPAYGNGLPPTAQAVPIIAPYAGLDLGYQWGKYQYTADINQGALGSFHDSLPDKNFDAPFFGALAGIKFNIPNYDQIFLGTQLTFDFYPGNYKQTSKSHAVPGAAGATSYAGLKQRWQTGLSILGGYHVTPAIMPYLIAGATYNGFASKYTFNGGTGNIFTDKKNFNRFGWLVGLGGEYTFTQNLAMRLEYNYQKYESYSYKTNNIAAGTNTITHHKIKFRGNNVLRANLLWYF
jgi:opacity protein-like surface antigen